MKELKKEIYDEKNGLHYTLAGDYYIPNITIERGSQNVTPFGKYGRMRRDFLKEYKLIMYNELVLTGKLHSHLAELDRQAHERLELIIDQMKEAEGVTEAMKRRDAMSWVQAMNSIRNRAEEIVLHELVYA